MRSMSCQVRPISQLCVRDLHGTLGGYTASTGWMPRAQRRMYAFVHNILRSFPVGRQDSFPANERNQPREHGRLSRLILAHVRYVSRTRTPKRSKLGNETAQKKWKHEMKHPPSKENTQASTHASAEVKTQSFIRKTDGITAGKVERLQPPRPRTPILSRSSSKCCSEPCFCELCPS